MQPVALYGAGDFAREVAWLVEECLVTSDERRTTNDEPSTLDTRHSTLRRVVCIVDDEVSNQGSMMDGIPVMDLATAHRQFPSARMVIAVGRPQTREQLAVKATAAGFRFDTIIHPDVRRSTRVAIGEGTVICAGTIITTDVVLGAHVQINLDCTIGHDTVLKDYATLAPGVHVSGHVNVGRRAYIGTGAVIINGCAGQPLTIGEDAIVAAGAVVTKPVPPRTTVVGVPARPIVKKRQTMNDER
jgi:sugar O-acyltransferase (sialic acid O-acetyltransferase NeuD family)